MVPGWKTFIRTDLLPVSTGGLVVGSEVFTWICTEPAVVGGAENVQPRMLLLEPLSNDPFTRLALITWAWIGCEATWIRTTTRNKETRRAIDDLRCWSKTPPGRGARPRRSRFRELQRGILHRKSSLRRLTTA